jgi:hypothetical protein
VMKYLRANSERGMVFRPGKGEKRMRVLVDAAYGGLLGEGAHWSVCHDSCLMFYGY